MIKNLVVNGCSFSELPKPPITVTWSQVVAEHLEVDYYKNIAMGGAGNTYIAHSTIDLLEHENLNPEETLVLIMWSGPSRKDVRVSKEWWDFIQQNGYSSGAQAVYGQSSDEEFVYWIFSGGAGGGWTGNKIASDIFKQQYKISNETIMCKESLECFNLLSNYLNKHNYQYHFMSFVNYWNTKSPLGRVAEYGMNYYCNSVPMYKNFDFSKWLFIDEDKNSLGEYAWLTNQYDTTNHPTDSAYREYAEKFIIPKLKKDYFR